jgi:hypothetical protein
VNLSTRCLFPAASRPRVMPLPPKRKTPIPKTRTFGGRVYRLYRAPVQGRRGKPPDTMDSDNAAYIAPDLRAKGKLVRTVHADPSAGRWGGFAIYVASKPKRGRGSTKRKATKRKATKRKATKRKATKRKATKRRR